MEIKRVVAAAKVQRVLLSGGHGLIGKALHEAFLKAGYEVTLLSRKGGELSWESLEKGENVHCLKNFDIVIHLAGENIANTRWTKRAKKQIWESRVHTSSLLAKALSALQNPPKILLTASACGFYGPSLTEKPFTEASAQGEGFLADLCGAWEKAWGPLERQGMRVVYLRFSPILSQQGGILKKLLLPFKLGFGGKMGDGQQFMSWISLSDVVGAMFHILKTPSLKGPINMTSPNPVRQKEFAKTLGKVLHRPVFFHIPKFLIEWVLGEKGKALILASSYVIPEKLQASGYRFQEPDLLSCFEQLF